MLVAGHETTGSALTWTLHLLVQNPDKMAKAQVGLWRVCVHVCACVSHTHSVRAHKSCL